MTRLIQEEIWCMMGAMRALLVGFVLIALAFAADDPWAKVIALKSGSEVRILKSGDKQPVTAQFSEADEERLIVVVKNTQLAIAKADVEKLEAKPPSGKRVKTEQNNAAVDPNVELSKPKVPVPGSRATPALQSATSGVTYTRPGFELVYRKGMK